jgi:hypothetical protein
MPAMPLSAFAYVRMVYALKMLAITAAHPVIVYRCGGKPL